MPFSLAGCVPVPRCSTMQLRSNAITQQSNYPHRTDCFVGRASLRAMTEVVYFIVRNNAGHSCCSRCLPLPSLRGAAARHEQLRRAISCQCGNSAFRRMFPLRSIAFRSSRHDGRRGAVSLRSPKYIVWLLYSAVRLPYQTAWSYMHIVWSLSHIMRLPYQTAWSSMYIIWLLGQTVPLPMHITWLVYHIARL